MDSDVQNGEVEESNIKADRNTEEEELERLAMEELIKEAKRGAERARDMGAAGWIKSQIPRANKRFLNNTVVSTLRSLHSPMKKNVCQQTQKIHIDKRHSFKPEQRESDHAWKRSRSSEHRRHYSESDNSHRKRHKSKVHKSKVQKSKSKRRSDTKESFRTESNHKSSRHEHKKSHRKSKKRKKEGKT